MHHINEPHDNKLPVCSESDCPDWSSMRTKLFYYADLNHMCVNVCQCAHLCVLLSTCAVIFHLPDESLMNISLRFIVSYRHSVQISFPPFNGCNGVTFEFDICVPTRMNLIDLVTKWPQQPHCSFYCRYYWQGFGHLVWCSLVPFIASLKGDSSLS